MIACVDEGDGVWVCGGVGVVVDEVARRHGEYDGLVISTGMEWRDHKLPAKDGQLTPRRGGGGGVGRYGQAARGGRAGRRSEAAGRGRRHGAARHAGASRTHEGELFAVVGNVGRVDDLEGVRV